MTEEKVHGSVQLEIQADYQYHPCIAQHGNQVYEQKQHEEDPLGLFRICQPQKDEVRYLCVILSTHSASCCAL